MTRLLAILLLAHVSAAIPAKGQESAPFGTFVLRAGDRGQALLAALEFPSALKADSVGVAACTVERAVGQDDYRTVVEPALSERLLAPNTGAGDAIQCAIWDFQEVGATRLFLEHMTEIRRESHAITPYPERISFEVRLQVLRNRDYREWHVITVRPATFSTDAHTATATAWRVVRYEVVGWQWMHEHSSSGGPVR